MLFSKDAARKSLYGVIIVDRNRSLEYDGSSINFFVGEMHGAATDFHSMLNGFLLRIQAWEGGQKRRMYVNDSHIEEVDELVRDYSEVSS